MKQNKKYTRENKPELKTNDIFCDECGKFVGIGKNIEWIDKEARVLCHECQYEESDQ